ncbi:unnamed protein product [Sphagnum jensenii]|uniref:Uncharacterized protein n=1 Tax=Sphagnum jensenii TaxID=128206 RepID=A0ABP0WHH6_9BRYO
MIELDVFSHAGQLVSLEFLNRFSISEEDALLWWEDTTLAPQQPTEEFFTTLQMHKKKHEQQLASNFIRMDRDSYMPDLIAASDCMLGKIGYGTVSETLSCNTPLVFVRRDHFNEEPFLRKMLEVYVL